MKKFYFLICLSLLFASVIISNSGCKTETIIKTDTITITPGGGGGGEPGSKGFSAKFDGTSKKASSATANLDNDGLMVITGKFGTLEMLQVVVSPSRGAEVTKTTYDCDTGEAGAMYVGDFTDTDTYYPDDTGKVTITDISEDTVSGTFEFTTKRGIPSVVAGPVITEGKFSCTLTHKPVND